jgi:long-chain acyl-CoA synthetase
MERFDAEEVLRPIDEHHVTHAQFVPTHFIRMLQLPDEIRNRYDLTSLRIAVHSAAPCPVPVKRPMLDWFGERIYEYYGGSESNGFVVIGPQEWLTHPGSVGRPILGILHLLDDQGHEVPTGQTGQIWFESPARFEYHNDPIKTAAAFNQHGWSSLGDIGRLDADGYLYLTDRVSHMIISGGVNIYPQEVENELAVHPDVSDVAVIGVPNAEFGEEVKAVVVPKDPAAAGPDLAQALLDHCRARLASFKCPKSIDFVDDLPRLPTGNSSNESYGTDTQQPTTTPSIRPEPDRRLARPSQELPPLVSDRGALPSSVLSDRSAIPAAPLQAKPSNKTCAAYPNRGRRRRTQPGCDDATIAPRRRNTHRGRR